MEVKKMALLFYSCKMSGILFHFLKRYTIPTFTKYKVIADVHTTCLLVCPLLAAKSTLSLKTTALINPHCLSQQRGTDLKGNQRNEVLHWKHKIKGQGHTFKMLRSIKQVVAVGCEDFTTVYTTDGATVHSEDSCLWMLGLTLCSEPVRTAAWSLAVVMK